MQKVLDMRSRSVGTHFHGFVARCRCASATLRSWWTSWTRAWTPSRNSTLVLAPPRPNERDCQLSVEALLCFDFLEQGTLECLSRRGHVGVFVGVHSVRWCGVVSSQLICRTFVSGARFHACLPGFKLCRNGSAVLLCLKLPPILVTLCLLL